MRNEDLAMDVALSDAQHEVFFAPVLCAESDRSNPVQYRNPTRVEQDDKDVEQHLGEPDSHVPGRALMPTVELRLCISNVGRGPRHLAA